MIGSEIIKIYRIDGEVNSTIIATSEGFYKISGNGFFEVNKDILKGHKEFIDVDESGFTIKEVKSSMEFTIIKLSNGDFIVHHVDTPFITIESFDKIRNDKDFLDWYENDLQLLTDKYHYATFKTD